MHDLNNSIAQLAYASLHTALRMLEIGQVKSCKALIRFSMNLLNKFFLRRCRTVVELRMRVNSSPVVFTTRESIHMSNATFLEQYVGTLVGIHEPSQTQIDLENIRIVEVTTDQVDVTLNGNLLTIRPLNKFVGSFAVNGLADGRPGEGEVELPWSVAGTFDGLAATSIVVSLTKEPITQ